jgi:hypothetical protein
MFNTTYLLYAHKISSENVTWSHGEVSLKVKIGYANQMFEYSMSNSGGSEYRVWAGFCINANNISDILEINQFMQEEPSLSMCNR